MAGSFGTLDPTGPCPVLAPHLEYPTRNGADILIDRKWNVENFRRMLREEVFSEPPAVSSR